MNVVTSPAIEPSAETMLRHLEHLFGGDLDGCHEGRIELAWTDAKDGRLRHAETFGTDQLDELAERAAAVNAVPGQNVYIGVALRKPDIPPFGRCKDEDFFALTAFYADLDDEGAAQAAKERYREAPPTAVVVTGRHPHLRAQMLWRQETPERDADTCRRQNSALAESLSGDRTVVNPSRVLRLGGSVAWPAKPGRIVERTEFLTFDDGRPKIYLPGQIAKAFPPASSQPAASSPHDGAPLVPQGTAQSAPLNIGTEFDGLSVEACLERIRAGDHWHDTLVRLTGHWIARGWSDAEILAAAASLTLPGYTVDQTAREVVTMIAGGRSKWNVPNPEHQVGGEEIMERPPIIDPTSWEGKPVPVREWLVENWVPLHYVTALYGDGGVGKTLLAQQLLTCVATGHDWLGAPVRRMKAFGLLCEDHADDLHINQEHINNAYWLSYGQLGDLRLWPSVGFDNLLMTFDGRDTAKGEITTFFSQLLDQIKAFGARFVVLDTAADLFGGNENIRGQVRQFVANACGRIAREIDGPVLLCAHPSLSGMASGTGAGGSTAWNNTVRSRLYLTRPKATDEEQDNPDLRVLTRVKANYAQVGEAISLCWIDGALLPVATTGNGNEAEIRTRVLAEIDRAWNEGQPYSDVPQARNRFVMAHLPRRIGIAKSSVEPVYLALLDAGLVRRELRDRHGNLRGLKVTRRMDELAGEPE